MFVKVYSLSADVSMESKYGVIVRIFVKGLFGSSHQFHIGGRRQYLEFKPLLPTSPILGYGA